jgi:ribosomal protein L11 methyltransferase
MYDENNTRVDVHAEKGSEELLPEEIYGMLQGHGLWIEEKGNDVLIRAYPPNVPVFVDYLKQLNITIKNITIECEETIDYAELTRKYFRPIKIEDVTILAPWHKKDKNKKHIVIEPGMAFGTGRHESTRLMFMLMKQIDMAGKSILDIGCGSGILSLYANSLGAKKIVSVDNDMDAVLSAKKNLELNNAKNIELICAELNHVGGAYDVILANLDIQTFMRFAAHIKKLLLGGGILLISGILTKNRKDLISLFYSLSLILTEKKNSWCGFAFKKTVQAD